MITRILSGAVALAIAGSAHAQDGLDLSVGMGYLPETTVTGGMTAFDVNEAKFKATFAPSASVGIPVMGFDTEFGFAYILGRKAKGNHGFEIDGQILPSMSVAIPVDGVDLKAGLGYLPETSIKKAGAANTHKLKAAFVPSGSIGFPIMGFEADFGISYILARKGKGTAAAAKAKAQIMPTVSVSIPLGNL